LSFALIKSSGIHPDVLSAARLGLAALLFAPLLRRAPAGSALPLSAIGAIQFGLMYVLVMRSYAYLEGHEVALLTVTTPILVVLFDGVLSRRVAVRALVAALVAVAGAAVLRWPDEGGFASLAPRGLVLVGAANAAWALGQVLYRRRALQQDREAATGREALGEFGWMYVGALVVAGSWAAGHVGAADLRLDGAQIAKLLYLGLIPSGLAFFLWNRGALRVNAGTLAVMNNLKVPLAVVVALSPPFQESFDAPRLAGSTALLAVALLIACWRPSPESAHV
ncbi:MAG: EamA family transporter, partial [Planctomycetota bacterium]